MNSLRYLLLLICFVVLASNSVSGQSAHFLFTSNTGNNATIAVQTSINPMIQGSAIAMGDEIGVFTPGGLCVGAVVWTGSNIAITVWGDNDQTVPVDGIAAGEQMQFRLWGQSTNTEYPAQVTYTLGSSTYSANGIYQLATLTANVTGPHFTYTSNTGNNATIAVQTSINPTIQGAAIVVGDEIGVFTPGGLCVGAAAWTGSNIAITVWGDNDQTVPADGFGAGEQMKFRLWRQSTNTECPAQVTYTLGSSSYTSNGIYQLGSLCSTSSLLIKIKVFLQGPYSGGVMATALNSGGLIPLSASTAYNTTTFGYTDKTVGSIPNANVVDWVLVDLRTGTAASTKVETQAGFLLSDGTLVDSDGSNDLSFSTANTGSYYIVVRHRNHLAVMSTNVVSLPNGTTYDFTVAGNAYGSTTPMGEVTTGVYGMWCGDTDGSGVVDVTDRANTWNNKNLSNVYNGSDTNLSNVIDVTDRAYTWNNRNITGQVPN